MLMFLSAGLKVFSPLVKYVKIDLSTLEGRICQIKAITMVNIADAFVKSDFQ